MSTFARRLGALALAGATLAAGLATAPSAAADPGARSAYVVQVARGASSAAVEQVLVAAGGSINARWSHAIQGFAVDLPDAAVTGLAHNPAVGLIEPDGVVQATLTVDNPQTSAPSWGLNRLDEAALPLDGSYAHDSDGQGVDVYVIDTGIYAAHEQFAGRIGESRNFVAKGRTVDPNDWNDCNGHGTHVAGTIGGTTTGVAKQVTLHAARVLNCQGSGSWSGVISGIDWVAGKAGGAKTVVANMSLGGSYAQSINDAVTGAIGQGVVMAVAAGNETTDACSKSPASAPDAITVGATTSSDAQASYSNFGTCVDIYAPGSSIYSSWNDGAYNTISGTSMATPHVAGAAARYVGSHPSATPKEVRDQLVGAAVRDALSALGSGSPNRLLNTCFMDAAQVCADAATLNTAPTVLISSPANGSSVTEGTSVTFTGSASDAEDAGLSSADLVWTSSVDGQIGTGATFATTGLSVGTHTVTASATDSGGAVGSASVTITVNGSGSVTAPAAPTLNSPTWKKRNARFSWNAPTSTGGPGVTIASYEYQFTGGYVSGVKSTTGTSVTLLGVKSKTSYTLSVRAVNSAGLASSWATGTFVAP